MRPRVTCCTRDRTSGRSARYFWKVRIWADDGAPSPWSAVGHLRSRSRGAEQWTASWISWDDHAVAFEPATESGAGRPGPAWGWRPCPTSATTSRWRTGSWAPGCTSPPGALRDPTERRAASETGPGAGLDGLRGADPVPGPRRHGDAHTPAPNAVGCTARRRLVLRVLRTPTRSGAAPTTAIIPSCWPSCTCAMSTEPPGRIVTDGRGRPTGGPFCTPIRSWGSSSVRDLHPVGWDDADFDDRRWHPVATRPLDGCRSSLIPVRRCGSTERSGHVRSSPSRERRTIVDFGQNLTGWIR